jgi:hypothetical protein
MSQEYLDQLAEVKHKTSVWKTVAIVSLFVIALQGASIVSLGMRLLDNVDRVRYILAPGVQSLTTVRPGELSEGYIEQTFRFVTDKLNSWSFESIKDNYKLLFDQFYAHTLKERTQSNLLSQHYFEDIAARKLVSFWTIIPAESEFHWCGKVSVYKEVKGVACGIVTGEQRLFSDFNVPINTQKLSYLIYAVNVAPTPLNFFATQITRIKHGPLESLRAELKKSLEDGVLPSEEGEL